MKTIYLTRHGQDSDNARHILNGHRNQSLTQLGKQQARQTGKRLLGKKISLIYTSPLKRCRQTASIVNKIIGGVPLIAEPLLIERDFGILTGRSVNDITLLGKNFVQSNNVKYFLTASQAEPFQKVLIRAKRALKKIRTKNHPGNILIVAHNDIGKMLQAAASGTTITQSLKGKSITNGGVVTLFTYR